MSDLISREDAIDIVRFECGEWRGLAKTIENGLSNLPSAQQWTPCSEGLPKTDDVYFVTIHPDYVPQACKQVDRMYYFEGEWRWLNEKAEWEKWPDPIIAWMPLPTPYEAEREEE